MTHLSRPRRSSLIPLLLILAGLFLLSGSIPIATARQGTPSASPESNDSRGVLPPAWLEFGPQGTLLARIVTDDECPALVLVNLPLAMTPRTAPTQAFPTVACEATIPFGVKSANIADQRLPLPNGPLSRIAVIGDTGCRLNDWEKKYQACNDPRAWPFATVAASVAAWQPDLIIHVGDYLYRESPCPAAESGCAGSPHGDTWATWNADFFTPAAPLLGVAPWLFIRGNHETCERNPEGWFAFLDPRPFQAACQQFTEPYVVNLLGQNLAVLDSAEAGDTTITPAEQKQYKRQFDLLSRTAPPGSWLVTHRPVRGILAGSNGEFEVDNASYQDATGGTLSGDFKLVLSGHIHLAESIAFDPSSARPPQLVSGNAGTALDDVPTASPTARQLDDPAIVEAETQAIFGFLTLEPSVIGWTATQRDESGMPILTCELDSATMECLPSSDPG